jgi:hypothetical protein
MERLYPGKGNTGQDRFGQWWVKEDGKRVAVLPKGLLGAFKNIVSGGTSAPFTTAGGILGGAAGGVMGAAAGGVGAIPGGIMGATVGAAAGKGLDDLGKWVMGVFAQKPSEVVVGMATEGALAGAFQGAAPVARAIGQPIKRGIQSFMGTRSEGALTSGAKLGRELGGERKTAPTMSQPTKAVPPIGSYAPGATGLEAKQQLRDILAGQGGSSAERSNIVYLNARMRGVLSREGFTEPEINKMMDEIRNTSWQQSGRAAGEAVVSDLRGVTTALHDEAAVARQEAEELLNQSTQILERMSRAPKNLGENIADAIVTERRRFGRRATDMYKAVDRIGGDQPLVPTALIIEQAKQFVHVTPPANVPPIIRDAARGRFVPTAEAPPGGAAPPAAPAPGGGAPVRPPGATSNLEQIRQQMQGMGAFQPQAPGAAARAGAQAAGPAADEVQHHITFAQAHALRTYLREVGEVTDIRAAGVRPYQARSMAGSVDAAMQNAEGSLGRQSAEALKTADTLWREGIRRYEHVTINEIVQKLKSGIVPEPETVVSLFMKKDNINLAREVIGMLPNAARQGVVQADLSAMLEAASTTNSAGRAVLDGQSLNNLLGDRHRLLEAIYPMFPGGRDLLNGLRLHAAQLSALDGRIDVTALRDPTQITALLRQSAASLQAADHFVRQNPLGALVNGTPAQIDRALHLYTRPGMEAVTENIARTVGPTSETWRAVQKFALQKLFAGSVVERKALDKTVAGESIDAALRRYTPRQQELLFPGGLADDLRLLAKEAKFLFPGSAKGDIGTSFASKSILHKSYLNPLALSRRIQMHIGGYIADHPAVLRYLTDEVRANPVRGRRVMSVIGQWILTRQLQGPGRGKAPPPPEPAPPAPTSYGGTDADF